MCSPAYQAHLHHEAVSNETFPRFLSSFLSASFKNNSEEDSLEVDGVAGCAWICEDQGKAQLPQGRAPALQECGFHGQLLMGCEQRSHLRSVILLQDDFCCLSHGCGYLSVTRWAAPASEPHERPGSKSPMEPTTLHVTCPVSSQVAVC